MWITLQLKSMDVVANEKNKPDARKSMNAAEAVSIALRKLKAERNFITFPFFALSNRDAARRKKAEVTIEFRNQEGKLERSRGRVLTAEGYNFPTPFDKKVHKAIEFLITQRGLPIENLEADAGVVSAVTDAMQDVGDALIGQQVYVKAGNNDNGPTFAYLKQGDQTATCECKLAAHSLDFLSADSN